jgi:hypothetical protein
MATKPSTLPTWATTGGTTVEPSAGEKAAGFAVATKPPARWMNWLLNIIYQWCSYLNDGVFTISGSGPCVKATADTGPALELDPDSSTISAERIGTQSAPSGAGLVGDRYTDSAGIVRTCRAAGTPGTFKAIGALQTRQVLSGSGTYTTPAGVSAIVVRCYGGGGGGAGALSAGAGQCMVGGGGASGGSAQKLILAPSASYPYVCGAAGTGGAGAARGTSGGDTTFNTTTVIALGGGGGGCSLSSASWTAGPGGDVSVATGTGDSWSAGMRGENGVCLFATSRYSGSGGSSLVGRGGNPVRGASANGDAALGRASGGGGALSYDTDGSRNGGAGTAGLIVVDEYY